KKDFNDLKIETNDLLLKKAATAIYAHINNNPYPPMLKTLGYHLIIKEGDNYFKVEQPVFTEYNIVYTDAWYFPNQYKEGVLNIAYPPYNKMYDMLELRKTAALQYGHVRRQLAGRTYLSTIDTSFSSKPIFHYW